MTHQYSTFARLRTANRVRQDNWPGADGIDLAFRVIEFGGEAGELQNAFKKLLRMMRNINGNTGQAYADLITAIEEEVGDVLITLDCMCAEVGVELADCVPMKFNKTSTKVGVPVFMDATNWDVIVEDRG